MDFPQDLINTDSIPSEQYLRALAQVAALRRTPTSIDELLPLIVDIVREASGAKYAALGVLTEVDEHGSTGETEDYIVQFIHSGIDEETAKKIPHHPIGKGLLGKIITEPDTLRVADRHEHPDSVPLPEHHPDMTNFLGTPVVVEGQIFGNLYLSDKEGGFTEEDQLALEIFSINVGVAIQSAMLVQQLRGVLLADERSRIARDMHDGVMQQLYSLGLTLNALEMQTASKDKELSEQLGTMVEQVDSTLNAIRSTIYHLRDTETDNETKSLQKEVVALAREYEHLTGIRPTITMSSATSAAVPKEILTDVVYLIKEVLQNACKHSEATALSLEAEYLDQEIIITITDNGNGFDISQPSAGHGLETMYERAQLIGGILTIDSKIDSGTTISLAIPIKEDTERR